MPTQDDFYRISGSDLIVKDANAFIASLSILKDERLFPERVIEIISDTAITLFDSNPSGVSINSIAQNSQKLVDDENIELDMPGYRKLAVPQFEPSGGVTAMIHIGIYAGVMGASFLIGVYHGLGE